MIRNYKLLGLFAAFFIYTTVHAQVSLKTGKWHAGLHRQDGKEVPFELEIQQENGKYFGYILNDTERMKTEAIVAEKDSLIIRMPVFESYFRVKAIGKDSLNGVWIEGGAVQDKVIPFVAYAGGGRFKGQQTSKATALQGKWRMEFTRTNQTKRAAIGEFVKKGNRVAGSVLTPSGDYRYLDGLVKGDSVFLSTFDGSHAILFAARIEGDQMTGNYYSGAGNNEKWTAVKDAGVTLAPAITSVKPGSDGKLDFTFKDLDGNPVSLQSDRYKGKVVILQLMGSWCPNCMDETAFLSPYYQRLKARGVEIIALAYELSTDEARSKKSIEKFRTQFKVQYPMLNTGVKVSDPERTSKTLPQLTDIKVFPTTIMVDKKGVVRDISTTFYGPGTGEYHVKYKAHFEEMIAKLLKEEA